MERSYLKERVERLQSRLTDDQEAGRPVSHVVTELERTARLLRDLCISIDWTEQQANLAGLPLAAFRTKIQTATLLASALEKTNTEKADHYWETSHKDRRVLEASLWLVDLQVPTHDAPGSNSGKEVESP